MIDLNVVEAAPVRYDLEEITRRLRATAHVWVPELFPHGRRQGDEWRLANIQGAPPRRSGSCVIMLRGEHAGDWHDFDGDQGGGPLSTLAHGTGLADRALFAHAAGMTGWTGEAPPRHEPAQPPRAEQDPQREIEHILAGAVPIVGTAAEAYLRGRGLSVPPEADLLFHPDLTHWETRRGFEAMLGVVRDRAGSIVALHRTYLEVDAADPTRVSKAGVSKPRMLLGKPAGGAVRLAPIGPSGVLGLCEGIETGLAAMAACPGLPVWAALSTTGLEQALLPSEARRIVILADHDASGAGLRAAEAAAAKLRLEGREIAIALPPDQGDDFNDTLRRHGPDAIAALVDAAMRSGGNAPRQLQQPAASGRHVPIGFVEPSGQLPMLRADDGDLKRATRVAWDLLYTSNASPWLFLVGGHPNWVVPDDDGRPVPVVVRDDRLRYMLARIARWCRINPKGEAIPVPPPADVVKNLLATPNPALPVLSGIVTAPAFGRSGTLLTEPGYHPDARLLYHPMPGFVLGSVAERPTAEAISAARSLLLDDLLGDFPFVGTAERAHALALLLLGFVRAMIDGPTPLHLIEKPTPGTGATLMVDAIATVLTGAGAPVMTEGRDEDEWRKRLTAKLRQLPPLLLIDNLRQELDSSALAAALTAPIWEDRVLGGSEMARLPIRCVWVATGNNPSFSSEIARRLVRIRLDARVEQPWRRDGFRHPSLIGWVRANRGALVAACLTLCQAWIAAGRPRGTRSIGSFEAWSQVIGGILEVAGVDGFLANLDEVMQDSDKEGGAWSGFVQTWWDRFGSADVSVSDLVGFAQTAEPALPISAKADHGMKIALGMALRKLRDRAFRVGARLVHLRSAGMMHNSQRWRLEPSADPGQGGLGGFRGDFVEKSPTSEAQGNPRVGGTWGTWGTFSDPHACARAHAREDGTEKDPQVPQVPQTSGNAWVCAGGTSGGLRSGPPKDPPAARLARRGAVMLRPPSTGPPDGPAPQHAAGQRRRAPPRTAPSPPSQGTPPGERPVGNPDHHDPLSETIMALATLTPPAPDASRGITTPLAVALTHRSVLALDLGTTTGWAIRFRDGVITSGTMRFAPSRFEGGGMRFLRFRHWLGGVARLAGKIERIVFEEVRAHAGTDAAHLYGGFLAHLAAWCEERGVAYEGVPVGTIKRFATGRGNADKAAMIAAMRARGFAPADDNEADAIALLLWATEGQGGHA